jgi:putative transcriptional regulator
MIYNRISVLRADANLSRQQLADKLQVNYQTIGFIERGDYIPSLELVFKIASVFDVEISTIFSEKPFKPLFSKQKDN